HGRVRLVHRFRSGLALRIGAPDGNGRRVQHLRGLSWLPLARYGAGIGPPAYTHDSDRRFRRDQLSGSTVRRASHEYPDSWKVAPAAGVLLRGPVLRRSAQLFFYGAA